MTFPQVHDLFNYWRKHPLAHELLAARYGFKPPISTEEAHAQGAMGPDELLAAQKITGGKIEGIGPV